MKKRISLILSFLIPSGFLLVAQGQAPDFVEHPVSHAQKVVTVDVSHVPDVDWFPLLQNTWVAPAPLTQDKAAFKKEKERANLETRATLPSGVESSSEKTSQSLASMPVLGQNFFGNTISGTPNDNSIAVDISGKVVSATNTSVCMYRASSATPVKNNISLGTFVGIPANAFVFDPRVVYDPNENRFVLVFLKDAAVGTSTIYVAFSATDDPFGVWNSYSISGTVSGRWTDYPQIGVNSDELFITGNMADDAVGGVVSGTIWQVNKMEGYAGAASITVKHFSVAEVGWQPVQGGNSVYGPNMYFLRTNNSPFGSTRGVYLRTMSGTIASNGVLSSQFVLNADISYSTPADASQKGSAVLLMTNGCGVQSSYLENNKIEFAMNSQVNSRPGLYMGTISLSPLGVGFSSVSGRYIGIDTLHLGYPAIAYAGSNGSGLNRSVIGFNFASSTHYPSNGCVYVDETGNVSAPLVIKNGFSFMDANMGASTRWGDYSGASERPNNEGEVWLGLSIGRSGSSTNGCWISQVYAAGSQAIANEKEIMEASADIQVYPNPAPEMVNFDFEVTEIDVYDVVISDASGKQVERFGSRRLKPGGARFSFNVNPLANGVYFVSLQNSKGEVAGKKFVVSH